MRGDRRRPTALSTTLLLWIGVLGLSAPPATASYFEDGVSFSASIERGSIEYRLNLKAVEAMGSVGALRVSISRSRDPEGLTALRQKQTWTFDLEDAEFQQEGGTYRIDAGGENEPFDIDVTVSPREGERCSDGQPLFVTRAENAPFQIETGNDTFGTITELPDCGEDWFYSSGERPGPPRCPVRGLELYASPLTVKERRDSDIARISYYDARERSIAGDAVQWYVTVRGTLPGGRFWMNRELDEGALAARGAPWLEGTARFHPRESHPTSRDWYNCTGGREARSIERTGSLTGDLVVEVIGYGSERVKAHNAYALRSWVRPRR